VLKLDPEEISFPDDRASSQEASARAIARAIDRWLTVGPTFRSVGASQPKTQLGPREPAAISPEPGIRALLEACSVRLPPGALSLEPGRDISQRLKLAQARPFISAYRAIFSGRVAP
jgi:hypothetical protein